MAYSINSSSDDCYEGTSCLINKLGIRDEEKLSEIEAQITFARAVMLEDQPINGSFDFDHYKKIHEYLFSDLYEWAGKARTINISKRRTVFLSADLIEKVGEKCFSKVKNGHFEDLSFETFAEKIAFFYNEVNFLHPFREGNGRTQRVFFTQLIRHYGYDINFGDVDIDELMIATIRASQGVMDFLINFFKGSIV